MDEEDKEEVIYHGTTADVAQIILATKRFELRDTYFAQNRELAQYFARRSASRRPAHNPVLVRIVLYRSDLGLWKRNRLIQSKGFDEADQTQLRGKTQLVFSAEGMKFLNRAMFPDDLAIEPVAKQ